MAGTRAVVSGWGATAQGGDSSSVLKAAEIEVLDFDRCNEVYKDTGGYYAIRQTPYAIRQTGKYYLNVNVFLKCYLLVICLSMLNLRST